VANRWGAVISWGVPIRLYPVAPPVTVKAVAPDFAIVATGALPRPAPFDTAALDRSIRVMHAWDYLQDLDCIRSGARVTIVGGGMVGMEAADLLAARSAHVTVIEALSGLAQGMARNNRMELIERVQARGAQLFTDCSIAAARGAALDIRVQGAHGSRSHEIGDVLLIAIGPAPVRDVVPVLEQAAVPYELVGDCYRPGDFLTALRDASMVALSVEMGTHTISRDAKFRDAHNFPRCEI